MTQVKLCVNRCYTCLQQLDAGRQVLQRLVIAAVPDGFAHEGMRNGVLSVQEDAVGVKLLILTRINPKQAIGSSLFARIFMAASAVVAYIISASAFQNVRPDWWLIVPLFAVRRRANEAEVG